VTPATRTTIAEALHRLGVRHGDVVLTHVSLARLGFVAGGQVAVVQALLDAVGPAGTLVVPAQTADNSDPRRWSLTRKEPVPEEWWPTIREHLPAFDPAVTPSRGMGAVAEQVRCWPGAVRSAHPQTSFAAVGARAEELMAGHDVRCHLGRASPLGRLRDADAKVLLLGVGFDVCTAFHYAEYELPGRRMRDYECVVDDGDGRRWLTYQDVELDDSDFARLGADFEAAGPVSRGTIGAADCRLFPIRAAVDFARTWMTANR
jgi:aminoglycoside 3-N-acetyltransferase